MFFFFLFFSLFLHPYPDVISADEDINFKPREASKTHIYSLQQEDEERGICTKRLNFFFKYLCIR